MKIILLVTAAILAQARGNYRDAGVHHDMRPGVYTPLYHRMFARSRGGVAHNVAYQPDVQVVQPSLTPVTSHWGDEGQMVMHHNEPEVIHIDDDMQVQPVYHADDDIYEQPIIHSNVVTNEQPVIHIDSGMSYNQDW